jgi:hypothetical protein
MEFTSVCPHCRSKNESTLDLVNLLGTITCPDFDSTIKMDGLEIFLKPQTFYDINLSGMRTFEEQRMLAVVQNTELNEQEKLLKFNELFRNVLNNSIAFSKWLRLYSELSFQHYSNIFYASLVWVLYNSNSFLE